MWRISLIAAVMMVFAAGNGALAQAREGSKTHNPTDDSSRDKLLGVNYNGSLMYLESGLVLKVVEGDRGSVTTWPRFANLVLWLGRDDPRKKPFLVGLEGSHEVSA
jgi:hypothetical protein